MLHLFKSNIIKSINLHKRVRLFIPETGYEMEREDIIPHYLQQSVIRSHVKIKVLAIDTELFADRE